jgi:hypothetical protein
VPVVGVAAPAPQRVHLGGVTRQLLARREREAAQGIESCAVPFEAARKKPLDAHLADFDAHLAASAGSPVSVAIAALRSCAASAAALGLSFAQDANSEAASLRIAWVLAAVLLSIGLDTIWTRWEPASPATRRHLAYAALLTNFAHASQEVRDFLSEPDRVTDILTKAQGDDLVLTLGLDRDVSTLDVNAQTFTAGRPDGAPAPRA